MLLSTTLLTCDSSNGNQGQGQLNTSCGSMDVCGVSSKADSLEMSAFKHLRQIFVQPLMESLQIRENTFSFQRWVEGEL